MKKSDKNINLFSNYAYLCESTPNEHAQIKNWSHIPQNLRNLQNLILIVFYIYPDFQNAINHLLAIYGSKGMDKSLEGVSFRVGTPKRNGVVHLKVVYSSECGPFGHPVLPENAGLICGMDLTMILLPKNPT